MIILGINAYHPDAAVALLKDGEVIWAAEEERYDRIRHASGFPKMALKSCFEETGIPPTAIDAVAISKNPHAHLLRKVRYVLNNKVEGEFLFSRVKAFFASSQFENDFFQTLNVAPTLLRCRFVHVEHHQCHVAASFFLSGFDRAAFLSLDDLGDFTSTMWGTADHKHIHVLDRVFFPHSAGFLYTAAAQFLGFSGVGEEWKVMELAGTGEPTYYDIFRRMIHLKHKGQFELNLDYFAHHRGHAKIQWERSMPSQDILYAPAKWQEKFGHVRPPEEPITDRDRNIAASAQAVLEQIYFHILNHLHKKTKEENLCLAGGVVLNGVANGKITKHTPFKNVSVHPAVGDAGTAIGAAVFVHHRLRNQPMQTNLRHTYLGSESSDEKIEKSLNKHGITAHKMNEDDLVRKTSAALRKGGIVGWFQGKMEFGPLSLGHRSILADPRHEEIKDALNKRIKHRLTYRPFACSVAEEKAKSYFEMDCESSVFKLKVFKVKQEKRNKIPAVIHADGTACIQTVSQDTEPLLWKLLNEFGKETGVPILLNTSFNEHEPIVRTPEEAIDCFLKTKMDVLVLGPYFVQKEDAKDLIQEPETFNE